MSTAAGEQAIQGAIDRGARWARLPERWGQVDLLLRPLAEWPCQETAWTRRQAVVDARGSFYVFAGSNNDPLLERAVELGLRFRRSGTESRTIVLPATVVEVARAKRRRFLQAVMRHFPGLDTEIVRLRRGIHLAPQRGLEPGRDVPVTRPPEARPAMVFEGRRYDLETGRWLPSTPAPSPAPPLTRATVATVVASRRRFSPHREVEQEIARQTEGYRRYDDRDRLRLERQRKAADRLATERRAKADAEQGEAARRAAATEIVPLARFAHLDAVTDGEED